MGKLLGALWGALVVYFLISWGLDVWWTPFAVLGVLIGWPLLIFGLAGLLNRYF